MEQMLETQQKLANPVVGNPVYAVPEPMKVSLAASNDIQVRASEIIEKLDGVSINDAAKILAVVKACIGMGGW